MQPPHPIDRSRLTRYVTSSRVRCAQSGSYSPRLNPRNLEADYYPVYSHTLADLANFEFEGAITVAQQFNVWLSNATFDLYEVEKYWFPDDDEGDDEEVKEMVQPEEGNSQELDMMDVDEIDLEMAGIRQRSSSPPQAPESGRPTRDDIKPPRRWPEEFLISPEARAALSTERVLTTEQIEHGIQNYRFREQLAANPVDATDADTSMETTGTVPDREAKNSYPDMLLCHWYAVDAERPDNDKAVFGWERRARCKIRHQCFPLIMEIKGCPSRSLRGKKLEVKKAKYLRLAAKDLYTYLQSYFARDVCAKRVIAMVACGPYWKWTQVQRDEISKATRAGKDDPYKASSYDSEEEIQSRAFFVKKLKKAPSFDLSTEASDEELTRLRDDFLIPLIEEHYRYPSTAVPNPQPTENKDQEGGEEGGQGAHEAHEENGGYQPEEDEEDEDEDDEEDEDEDEYDEDGEDEEE